MYIYILYYIYIYILHTLLYYIYILYCNICCAFHHGVSSLKGGLQRSSFADRSQLIRSAELKEVACGTARWSSYEITRW